METRVTLHWKSMIAKRIQQIHLATIPENIHPPVGEYTVFQKNMNLRSTVISTLALALIFLSTLFPPVRSVVNSQHYANGRGCVVFNGDRRMTSFGGVYAQIDFPMLVAEWVRILSVAGVALVLANIKITTAKNGSKEIAPPNGP